MYPPTTKTVIVISYTSYHRGTMFDLSSFDTYLSLDYDIKEDYKDGKRSHFKTITK